MLIRATLCTLSIILIIVISISYYVNKEGFEDITNATLPTSATSLPKMPAVILEACSDNIWFNIKAKTKDGSTITGAKLVYSSTCNTIDNGNKSDSVLAENLTIPPTLTVIATIPLNSLVEGKTYYLIDSTNSSYIAGTTTLLNGILYAKSLINTCITSTTQPTSIQNTLTPSSNSSTQTTPQNNQVVPQVTVSDNGFNAMALQQRMELLKDIQKVVRNEMISQRSTDTTIKDTTLSCNKSSISDSTAQGKEYSEMTYKDNSQNESYQSTPDMSKYIKKDAIPCWGCSLDY